MASQFQNRLVGAVILVALGIIILPDVLDSQKKHQEDFAAIPLKPTVQEAGNRPDLPPAISQPLQPLPPAEPVSPETANPTQPILSAQSQNHHAAPTTVAPPTLASTTTAKTPEVNQPVHTKPVPTKPIPTKPAVSKPITPPVVTPPKTGKQPEKEVPEAAPSGKAYVVQLGALKNASKVNELLNKLRAGGYKAYSQPSPAVGGQLNRIYVGPDASKEKLLFALDDMQRLTGLRGQVRGFDPLRH
ncbi:MAG: cell division protein DedD [Plesiomonas sp.]|uniref:cell division protein DedD n=1 Tax=Plesiomonas sp. TaxID=2486279 RepID=UPI003F2ADBCA